MVEAVFTPGQRVFVPWGLDVVDGTVLEVKGDGPGRRVVVQIVDPEGHEEAEPLVMTFRPADLEAAAEEASERRPGAWLSAARYEEKLRDAVNRLLDKWPQASRSIQPPHLVEERDIADFALRAADHLLLIEAKAPIAGQVPSKALDQLWSHARSSRIPVALLVTNGELSLSAQRRLRELVRSGAKIGVVRWSSLDDNEALGSAIEEALSGS